MSFRIGSMIDPNYKGSSSKQKSVHTKKLSDGNKRVALSKASKSKKIIKKKSILQDEVLGQAQDLNLEIQNIIDLGRYSSRLSLSELLSDGIILHMICLSILKRRGLMTHINFQEANFKSKKLICLPRFSYQPRTAAMRCQNLRSCFRSLELITKNHSLDVSLQVLVDANTDKVLLNCKQSQEQLETLVKELLLKLNKPHLNRRGILQKQNIDNDEDRSHQDSNEVEDADNLIEQQLHHQYNNFLNYSSRDYGATHNASTNCTEFGNYLLVYTNSCRKEEGIGDTFEQL